MIKKKFLVTAVILAFLVSASGLYAQDPPKPKGPEKLMIYDSEYVKVQLYGFVKVDVVYNTQNVVNDSSPLFVNNQYLVANIKLPPDQRDGSFTMDARTTRLGLKITGPTAYGLTPSALVEMDFWGDMVASATAARQGEIRMRHALGRLDWKAGDIYKGFILIGQFWSLMTPTMALADTATFIPFGTSGLMFMREPQIAMGHTIGPKAFNVAIEASISRVQGGNDSGAGIYPGPNGSQTDAQGPGEASKIPGFRGRITFNTNPIDILNITVGGAAHYQYEKHPLAVPLNLMASTVDSYSIEGFGKISVSLFTVVGAYFIGDNLDTFLCGLGQGVVQTGFYGQPATVIPVSLGSKFLRVSTHGGYVQGQIDLRKVLPVPLKINGGYGAEIKSNRREIAAGSRMLNQTIQGNVWWYINHYMSLGFEVAQHISKYKGFVGDSEDMRFHGAMMFKF